MSVLEMLGDYRKTTDRNLRVFFESEIAYASGITPQLGNLLSLAEDYALRGGKRFRAFLVYLGYRILGGSDPEAVSSMSHFIELTQDWLLIHDDICDRADSRRGGASLQGLFQQECGFDGIDDYDAVSGALLLGDLMEPYAIRIITESPFDSDLKVRVLREYSDALIHTGYGQLLDMSVQKKPLSEVSEEDVLKIHEHKTSHYTVAFPLVCGGIFAGSSNRELESIRTYGQNLGIAFQIVDDILGAGFSSDPRVGKSANDIQEGKRTLLIVRAWQAGSEEDRTVIEGTLGNRGATEKEIADVQDIIRKTGSLEHSTQSARRLSEEAMKTVGELELPSDSEAQLRELIDVLIERSY